MEVKLATATGPVPELNGELVGVLTAISIVSQRLAANLNRLQKKLERED